METLTRSVTQEVRAEMARQRITQRDLAIRCGWQPGYLARRLQEHTPFDVEDLAVMAHVLGVSVVQFVMPRQRKEVSL